MVWDSTRSSSLSSASCLAGAQALCPHSLSEFDPNSPAQSDYSVYHQGDPGLPGKVGERGPRVSMGRKKGSDGRTVGMEVIEVQRG